MSCCPKEKNLFRISTVYTLHHVWQVSDLVVFIPGVFKTDLAVNKVRSSLFLTSSTISHRPTAIFHHLASDNYSVSF